MAVPGANFAGKPVGSKGLKYIIKGINPFVEAFLWNFT